MKTIRKLIIPTVAPLCLAIASASATVRHVDMNSASPTPPYTNWATAAATIQDAVNAAVAGDEIVVTNGIYATGGVPGNARVTVTNRLSLRSVNGPQFTVIRGGSRRCAYLAGGASLSGFTLTNGSTPNPYGGPVQDGGGVLCSGTNAVVSDCVLVGNSATGWGGGAYGGTLINCTLTNNSAWYGGGAASDALAVGDSGVVLLFVPGCTLINCTLTGNSASTDGGGAYGACTLINCTLTNNSAPFGGAGASVCTLNNCTLTGNSGDTGARDCTLNNCTLTRHFGAGGGARYCKLNNCTLTRNRVGAYGGTLRNCIAYDNQWADYDGNSTLNFCCTRNMPANGIGNITDPPLFINPSGGNLRLQFNSPCINAGNNAYVATSLDHAGRPRLIGGAVDMGAHEFQGPFDNWLQQYGLATDGAADFIDTDADGLNNWQEWIAGIVPTNALSALQLLNPTHNASGMVVTWQSVNDRIYFLERSTNLGANPVFLTLAADIAGQPGTTSYTDTNANGPGPYFYRVGVQTDYQFTYTTNSGTITITGYADLGGAAIIPGTINGLPVTSIGNSAFFGKPSLTSVWIPTSVTNIGVAAFAGCFSLTSVTIPDGVISIGVQAFQSCTRLASITIPNNVTNIGDRMFDDCSSLASITIPNSVTSIGDSAFNSCTSLASVTIGNSVASIGHQAFFYCTRLTTVTIPNCVTNIGDWVFANCTSLTAINVDALNPFYRSVTGVLFNRSETLLIAYPAGKSGSDYTIPVGVTTIGDSAFFGSGLTSITIPGSVTSIGVQAFTGSSLTSVTIPNRVSSIGSRTFSGCASLTNITIPGSVTSIGVQAFQSCTRLASITIPNGVTNIGDWAFAYCTSLTGVYFRGNAPTLGGSSVFQSAGIATVYYLPGTTGWGSTFGGRPTALWLLPDPLILNNGPSFGVRTNAFGFIISWATNVPVVVEASTNLAVPVWAPVSTNTLSGGWSYFSDPQWTNYPSRIYRVRSL